MHQGTLRSNWRKAPVDVVVEVLVDVAAEVSDYFVFTFVDMAFPYPSDTQSDMCAKQNVKRNLPRPGSAK
jgi:hypothetical protein